MGKRLMAVLLSAALSLGMLVTAWPAVAAQAATAKDEEKLLFEYEYDDGGTVSIYGGSVVPSSVFTMVEYLIVNDTDYDYSVRIDSDSITPSVNGFGASTSETPIFVEPHSEGTYTLYFRTWDFMEFGIGEINEIMVSLCLQTVGMNSHRLLTYPMLAEVRDDELYQKEFYFKGDCINSLLDGLEVYAMYKTDGFFPRGDEDCKGCLISLGMKNESGEDIDSFAVLAHMLDAKGSEIFSGTIDIDTAMEDQTYYIGEPGGWYLDPEAYEDDAALWDITNDDLTIDLEIAEVTLADGSVLQAQEDSGKDYNSDTAIDGGMFVPADEGVTETDGLYYGDIYNEATILPEAVEAEEAEETEEAAESEETEEAEEAAESEETEETEAAEEEEKDEAEGFDVGDYFSYPVDDLAAMTELADPISLTVKEREELENVMKSYTPGVDPLLFNQATNFYFYDQLTTDEQDIYDAVYLLCQDPTTSDHFVHFTVEYDPMEDEGRFAAQCALMALKLDHPELFWLWQSEACDVELQSMYRDNEDGTYERLFRFSNPFEEFEVMMTDFNFAADAFLEELYDEVGKPESIGGEVGNDEFLLVLHDKLTEMVTYDSDTRDRQGADLAHTAYGALVENSAGEANCAVCDGYSFAMQYLLQQVGIDCITVLGNAGKDMDSLGGHAWNLVKSGDYWHESDATWDDLGNMETELEKADHDSEAYIVLSEAIADPEYRNYLEHYVYWLTTEQITHFISDTTYTTKDGQYKVDIAGESYRFREFEEDIPTIGRLMGRTPVAR